MNTEQAIRWWNSLGVEGMNKYREGLEDAIKNGHSLETVECFICTLWESEGYPEPLPEPITPMSESTILGIAIVAIGILIILAIMFP